MTPRTPVSSQKVAARGRSAAPASRTPAKRPNTGRLSSAEVRAFLDAHLGEPWVQVTAAFALKYPRAGDAAAQALRQLDVATRTVLRDGKVRVQTEHKDVLSLEDCPQHYYLEPTAKTLLRNEARLRREQQEALKRARAEQEAQARRRDLAEGLQAHKVGEVWWVVELADLGPSNFDVMLSRHVTAAEKADLQRLYGKGSVFARQRRELSYREKHQLGLA